MEQGEETSMIESAVPPSIRGIVTVLICGGLCSFAASPLYLRGYAVIPEPQKIELKAGDFAFDNGWQLRLAPGVTDDNPAAQTLKEQLAERYGLRLSASGQRYIELVIRPGAVE